jgi:ATP-dependent Lon protease
VLNEDHYGLDKVKDRILEYLAVQQRVDKVKAPILCLVGPARASARPRWVSRSPRPPGRKYVRMALGGMRDEAEIRGHRRTYIGAMPGKVLQSLNKVAPATRCSCSTRSTSWAWISAAIRPARCWRCWTRSRTTPLATTMSRWTSTCRDVMFVATSNSMNIPPALLDRMEVIRLSGYTEDEKTNIAMKYLLPKQMKNNGVKDDELQITEERRARHRALLHPRGRRALAGARALEDLPQGGQGPAAQEDGGRRWW